MLGLKLNHVSKWSPGRIYYLIYNINDQCKTCVFGPICGWLEIMVDKIFNSDVTKDRLWLQTILKSNIYFTD